MPSHVYNIYIRYTTQFAHMRTNIEIDDDLMDEALKVSGLATKRTSLRQACAGTGSGWHAQ